MSDNNFYTQRFKNIFLENKITAHRLKSQFREKLDPILQSSDKYKEKEYQSEKFYLLRHLQISKPREEKFPKRTINPKLNAFRQSEPDSKPKNKKIFSEIYTKKSGEFKEKSVKIFPEKLASYHVAKLISNGPETEGNLKISFEKKIIKNIPSTSLQKINDKKGLRPFEFEEKYNSQLIRRSSSNINVSQNTYHRIFQNQPKYIDKNNQTLGLKRTNSTRKLFRGLKTDNISGIISYEFGPKFRNEILTDKPNNLQIKRPSSVRLINYNSSGRI